MIIPRMRDIVKASRDARDARLYRARIRTGAARRYVDAQAHYDAACQYEQDLSDLNVVCGHYVDDPQFVRWMAECCRHYHENLRPRHQRTAQQKEKEKENAAKKSQWRGWLWPLAISSK